MDDNAATTPHFTVAVSLQRYIAFYIAQRGDYRDLVDRVDIGIDQPDIGPRTVIPPDAVAYEIRQLYMTEQTPDVPQLSGPLQTIVPYTFIDPMPLTARDIEAHVFSLNVKANETHVADFLKRLKHHRIVCRRKDGQVFSGETVPFYDTKTGKRGTWARGRSGPVKKFGPDS